MENEKIIVKGKNIIILLFVGLVLWVLQTMYYLLPWMQRYFLSALGIIFSALYMVMRGLSLLINSERASGEKVIFTEGFMMDDLEDVEDDLENKDILEKFCIYVSYIILCFMPIYFIAYVIRKILTSPTKIIKNLFAWADIYLTIKSKNVKVKDYEN